MGRKAAKYNKVKRAQGRARTNLVGEARLTAKTGVNGAVGAQLRLLRQVLQPHTGSYIYQHVKYSSRTFQPAGDNSVNMQSGLSNPVCRKGNTCAGCVGTDEAGAAAGMPAELVSP